MKDWAYGLFMWSVGVCTGCMMFDAVSAAEFELSGMVRSYHINTRGLNEFNPGVGIGVYENVSKDISLGLSGGAYRNSFSELSTHVELSVGYSLNEYVEVGLSAGVVSGYGAYVRAPRVGPVHLMASAYVKLEADGYFIRPRILGTVVTADIGMRF